MNGGEPEDDRCDCVLYEDTIVHPSSVTAVFGAESCNVPGACVISRGGGGCRMWFSDGVEFELVNGEGPEDE